jgi:hypothetical protein
MLKIVTRLSMPSVDPASFPAQPKTLYRLGTRYGRLEEGANPATGIHSLAVVNEPDVWLVNRVDRTGRHVVDPGPSLNFRAQVFGGDGVPAAVRDLELGCEQAFLDANAARPAGTDSVRGQECALQRVEVGEFRVAICLATATRAPRRITIHQGDRLHLSLDYDSYEVLPTDLGLFERPAGIVFPPPR